MDQTKSEIDSNSDETQPDINNNRPASTILKTGSTIQRTDMPTKTTIERQRPTTSTSTPLIQNNQVAKGNLLKNRNTYSNCLQFLDSILFIFN